MKKKYIKNTIFLCILAIVLTSAISLPSYFFVPGISEAEPIAPYLNNIFPKLMPTAGSGSEESYSTVNAFPNLTFKDPVDILEMPDKEHLLVLGLQGQVWKIKNDSNTNTKELLLDVNEQVVSANDGGMLGIVLHPEYGKAGSPNEEYIYIYYRYTPVGYDAANFVTSAISGYMRLSRFELPVGGNRIDPASEYVMINNFDRHEWHNGGDMFFHPDNGFLYLVIGDEGGANDYTNVTQQIDKYLFSGILRIDVDKRGGNISHPIRKQPLSKGQSPAGWPPTFTQGYYIPNDNPWVDETGNTLEEFYAIGLRSPHRMTLDEDTGDIWIGDIGQSANEEISLARKGDNMQWPYMEGLRKGRKAKPTNLIGTDRPPIHAYGRSTGRSVIGGFVYKGEQFQDLKGKYLFGDHETQNVWTLTKTGENKGDVNFLLQVPIEGTGGKDGISSFYGDSKGDIFIMDLFGSRLDGGKIRKIIRTDNIPDPPSKLSELGAFSDLEAMVPAAGIIPYDVNTPLWSDGATKKRWVALPNNGNFDSPSEKINFSIEGDWKFPAGTVAIKHFELPVDQNDLSKTVKLETRFLVFTDDGKAYAVTYKWNKEQTDAFLVGFEEAVSEDYEVVQLNGSVKTQRWDFPTRQQCMECHNSNTGYGLGLKTRQLNKEMLYPSGVHSNQLKTWEHLGMFDQTLEDDIELPSLVSLDDPDATNDMKVRSYVDANCAYCHRPGGVSGAFDGRSLTAFDHQRMANTTVISNASPSGAKVIVPGDASSSVLYIRDISSGSDKMPPIGRNEVDKKYVDLLQLWIDGLQEHDDVAEGLYEIQLNSNKRLLTFENTAEQEKAKLIYADFKNPKKTWWIVEKVNSSGNALYRIRPLQSTSFLGTKDLRTGSGASAVIKPWNSEQQQMWYFEKTGQGNHLIKNAYNGMALELSEKNSTSFSATLGKPVSESNQQWNLQKVDYNAFEGENLALNKPAEQSSTRAAGGAASRAVDGNTSGLFADGSVTHTSGAFSWWRVDLGAEYEVSGIRVFNRTGAPTRLNGTSVYVGSIESDDVEDYKKLGELNSSAIQEIFTNSIGRYVFIKKDNTNFLSLAEVQVYGELASETITNIALNKPAEQSSVYKTGVPSLAVDGNSNSIYAEGSVTHTNRELAWWRVDLGAFYDISQIKIFNRSEAVTRLNGTTVYVGNKETNDASQYTKVGELNSDLEQVFDTNETARYVFIKKERADFLSLAEVEVYGIPSEKISDNLALHKPARQSSTRSAGGAASRAVDGNTSGIFAEESVTHTNKERGWWQVDLGAYYDVSLVRIFNRAEIPSRLNKTSVYIGKTNSTNPEDHTKIGELNSSAVQEITTNKTLGRYVFIKKDNSNFLSLAEVQVFGELTREPTDNIALNKPAEQSSTRAGGGAASRAVDGNTSGIWNEGSVTHTNKEQAWWRVDLGAEYNISLIRVHNRVELPQRLRKTGVYVGSQNNSAPSDYSKIGDLQGIQEQEFIVDQTARYVFIKKENNNYLSIAEVEVYGELSEEQDNRLTSSNLKYSLENSSSESFDPYFLLFPNPVSRDMKITADIKLKQKEELTFTIHGLDGKSYLTRTNFVPALQVFEQFEVSNLSPGLYILTIKGSNWTQSKRFIVK